MVFRGYDQYCQMAQLMYGLTERPQFLCADILRESQFSVAIVPFNKNNF